MLAMDKVLWSRSNSKISTIPQPGIKDRSQFFGYISASFSTFDSNGDALATITPSSLPLRQIDNSSKWIWKETLLCVCVWEPVRIELRMLAAVFFFFFHPVSFTHRAPFFSPSSSKISITRGEGSFFLIQ